MSAVGKLDFLGDFDEQGQLVETPYRPQLAKKSQPAKAEPKLARSVPQHDRQKVVQDLARPAAQPPMPGPLFTRPTPADLTLDRSRDILLTSFGKATLTDRYLMPGESFQDMFARVSCAYADDVAHAQRLYDAMSQLWFMPATPILSNGGTKRGLPISCFLNDVSDSLDGIVGVWNENVALASNGGGIGTYWGKVRSIGEKVKTGQTSGIIPFIHVMDGLTLAISQGSLRRGSAAVYLDISHPEIEEFLEIRKASGDFNRKGLNLHHGINITDEFMHAVRDNKMFGLKSPRPAKCCARSTPASSGSASWRRGCRRASPISSTSMP